MRTLGIASRASTPGVAHGHCAGGHSGVVPCPVHPRLARCTRTLRRVHEQPVPWHELFAAPAVSIILLGRLRGSAPGHVLLGVLRGHVLWVAAPTPRRLREPSSAELAAEVATMERRRTDDALWSVDAARAIRDSASVHRIKSSARSSSDFGTVIPSAFAVLRLITSSNFIGCSTGISPGFLPLKILSMKLANRK